MNRRHFLKLSSLAAVAPFVGCSTSRGQPNVLFIAIDDLNDWVGFLDGHPDTRTPNLDALAQKSVIFANAHCNAPTCGGSRTAIMTGRAPYVTGIFNNHQPFRPTYPDLVTLPQQYIQSGYRVAMGGKVFHIADPPSEPEVFGFETGIVEVSEAGRAAGYNSPIRHKWGPVDLAVDDMIDAQLANQTAAFLAQPHEAPFFLGVGLYSPHFPWFAPMEYFEQFPPDEISLPVVKEGDIMDVPRRGKWMGFGLRFHRPIVESGQWTFAVSSYLSCIHFLDAMLGRIFDALAMGPNGDNTIVVLWSDHGFLLGEKYHWSKFVLWERATRVPLLIYDPRAGSQGKQCNRTVSLVDLYPTLLELCGLPPAEGVSGTSLVPLIRNAEASWEQPVLTSASAVTHAVRSERWRYIRYGDGSEELYDHRTDPLEWNNLASLEEFNEIKTEHARSIPSPDEIGEGPPARRWRRGG